MMSGMRTTIDLPEDLILVTKQMAQSRHSTMGQIVSELLRKAMAPSGSPKIRNGFQLLEPKAGAAKPSLALVNRLRDEG
jgi:hypothetical protein